MPSASLVGWINDRTPCLDEIDAQCSACNVAVPLNVLLLDENIRGYILLLSAHFQGYCRDLYTECTQFVAAHVRPRLKLIIQQQFTANRALDHGNPNIDNIRKDFNRFGLSLNMAAADPANHARLAHLKRLNEWRNIAAHHGVVPPPGIPTLALVQAWRISCGGLATSLDGIMYNQLRTTLNKRPWAP
jgi:adenosine deaminase